MAVKFKEITKTHFIDLEGNLGVWTYKVYIANSKKEAIEFLKKNPVHDQFLYLVIETPEGNYGRDILGIYREGDNIFIDLKV